jgi:hypothetical protein
MGVFDRITIEPGRMGGQPCIRRHRFTVEHLLSLVGAGWTLEQIQKAARPAAASATATTRNPRAGRSMPSEPART